MILFFFMPWAQLLGTSVSGYDLQKLGSYGNLAWLIPVCSGITIVVGFYGKRQRTLAQLTGALPILGLVYGLEKLGPDLFHILAIGAYLTLITGIALLVVSLISLIGQQASQPFAHVSRTVVVSGDVTRFGDSRFYVRVSGRSDFTGPFTAPELKNKLATVELHGTDAVVEAVGQTYGKLKRMTEDEWTPLNKIFEIDEGTA